MRNKIEQNRIQREYRKANRDACTKKYEKTPNGFLMRMYRNMQSRVTGVQKLKKHLYKGKALLDRQVFYSWAKSSTEFWKLYSEWIRKNYDRKLTPTIDRTNSSIGYKLSNMEWVTHSENSRRGAKSKKHKLKI